MKNSMIFRRTALVLIPLLILAILGFLRLQRVHQTQATVATFPAARGPLSITVEESGTIHPQEKIIIKSELEGRNRILSLIPEGTVVAEGDLLVELDASSLEERRVDLDISVQNAEAAFIRSRENLAVVRNQAKSDVERAELDLQFAREDVIQYREGEYPNRLKELEARITLAREEQQRALEKLQWSEVLLKEKYLAESEVQADQLAVQKTQLDVELAENNLRFLKDFEYQREITQLESDLAQAEMALERVERRAKSDVIQADAELRARESEFQQKLDQLQKLDEQIRKARIYAPREGLVIYATSTRFSWRGNVEPLDEGQEVNERQELIHLPTAAGYMAQIKIHESSVKKVEVGDPVTIRVSSLPNATFEGSVRSIAPLPDPTSTFMNPDLKLYDTDVTIEGGTDVLKTGMSCQTRIHVAEWEDAIHVPVQCVVRTPDRQTVVFLQTTDGPQQRVVEIGDDNSVMIHIRSGLSEGEPVILTPPISGNPSDQDADPTKGQNRRPLEDTPENGNKQRRQGSTA